MLSQEIQLPDARNCHTSLVFFVFIFKTSGRKVIENQYAKDGVVTAVHQPDSLFDTIYEDKAQGRFINETSGKEEQESRTIINSEN